MKHGAPQPPACTHAATSDPTTVSRPGGWMLVFAAVLALVLSIGLYVAGIFIATDHPRSAAWLARVLNVMGGASATLACLAVMVTFTEGTAARKFENFFGFISEAEEGVKSKFMAPFFVMTGALFGFGAGIAGTLGENWSDPLHVKEWAYWIGGLSATLAVSFWIAQRLESPDTTPK